MLSKNDSWNWNQHKLESFFLKEISGTNSCVQRYQPKLTKYYQRFLCSLKSDAWSEMVDRARWWIEEEQTFACFSKPENLPRLSAFVHKLGRGIRDRPQPPRWTLEMKLFCQSASHISHSLVFVAVSTFASMMKWYPITQLTFSQVVRINFKENRTNMKS